MHDDWRCEWSGGLSAQDEEPLKGIIVHPASYDYGRIRGWLWEMVYGEKTYSSGTLLSNSCAEAMTEAQEFLGLLKLRAVTHLPTKESEIDIVK